MARSRSVQAFRDESRDLEARIIQAITSVGPRNVAKIARLTGAHPETIRYKIRKQLTGQGFRFQAEPDFQKIGLRLFWGSFEISPAYYNSAGRLFRVMNKSSYLIHFSKILPQGHFVALFALPRSKGPDFKRLLGRLVERRIFVNFELDEVLAERHKAMDPTYFNFEADRWEVDWRKVQDSPGARLSVEKLPAEQQTDRIDLMIIKELQKDALQHLVRLAPTLKTKSKTLEYHFRTHVVKQGLIAGYRTRWMKDITRNLVHSMIIVRMTFKGLGAREFQKSQTAVSKIPFLWAEDLLKDGTYIATLNIPAVDFVATNTYLNDVVGYLGDKVQIGYLKVSEASNFTIPYEKFVDGGWEFDVESMENEIVKDLNRDLKK